MMRKEIGREGDQLIHRGDHDQKEPDQDAATYGDFGIRSNTDGMETIVHGEVGPSGHTGGTDCQEVYTVEGDWCEELCTNPSSALATAAGMTAGDCKSQCPDLTASVSTHSR